MSRIFEELARSPTPLGDIVLRRRREPISQRDIFEVILAGDGLMSSLFTHGEEQLTEIGLAAVAGLSSVILVDMVAMGRIGFALARDGLLPPVFRKIHPTWHTPVLMTSLTVAVVAVLAAFVPLADLAEMVSIGTLFAFLVVSIAVPVLRVKRPDMQRPFRTPLSPVLPIVSVPDGWSAQ